MQKFTFKQILIALTFIILLYFLHPLEYGNFKMKTVIYLFIWISIAVIVINVLPKRRSLMKTLGVSIGVLVYFFATCFFGFSFLFCRWENHGIIYINKSDNSIKIICRTYDCYGTAEGCELFKARQLTKHIKWVTEFNDDPVDTTKWRRTDFNSDELNQ
jgi:hypothetical protein